MKKPTAKHKTVTAAQMRRMEKEAEKKYGISTLILMENAGRSVAEAIARHYPDKNKRILILCGKGNNGGDGFVAARHLVNGGYPVRVLFWGDVSRLSPDAGRNYEIVRSMRIGLVPNPPKDRLKLLLGGQDVLVDALFGTGLKRNLEEPYLGVIRAVNDAGKPVVSVDLPSGIDADNGEVRGAAVKARVTVALAFIKKGLTRGDGPRHAGRILIGDIGLPSSGKQGGKT